MPETIRFARKAFVRVQPGKGGEFVKAMVETIYPKVSKERGIRRIYLLRDSGNPDEFVSLTLWNSKNQADVYEDSGHFREYIEMVADKLLEPVTMTEYSVEHHQINPSIPPPKPKRVAPPPKKRAGPPPKKKKKASRK
jgi:quinol monooxygenase YgiN